MSIFREIWNIIIEAIFPLSDTEKELLSLSPEQAFDLLPPAPTPPIKGSSSVFAYKDERVSKLIWNIKYKKSSQAIKIGGYALWRVLSVSPVKIVVIPMPIATRRRRERGFNQCELLVDEIAKLDKRDLLIIEKSFLKRIRYTPRQTLKRRVDRLESVKDIFSINREMIDLAHFVPSSSRVVIIDDVITTGSTLKEAIKTLKDAGFQSVYGLSLAH